MRRALLTLPLFALLASAQPDADRQIKEAGVCARCHVISVVEWGVSKHWKAGTGCVACHGASQGHVIDERNNVKPDRMPTGDKVAGLCAQCHAAGCPRTKRAASCQDCHHVHALVDPKAPARAAAPEPRASAPAVRDAAPVLPPEIRVPDVGIVLVLIKGGEVELGSDTIANARPVHTVRVEPFYIATREVTAGQWRAVMGGPAPAGGADLPAARISWLDARTFLARLNERAPGSRFRLPTEAEWEFAARSAGAFEGDALNLRAPRPAGVGKPSAAGLFDLRGNVQEWCSSLDRPYPYDPADGRESPDADGLRILRGGGYNDTPEWVGPASRHGERPTRRLPWNGFRIACSASR